MIILGSSSYKVVYDFRHNKQSVSKRPKGALSKALLMTEEKKWLHAINRKTSSLNKYTLRVLFFLSSKQHFIQIDKNGRHCKLEL